MHSGWLDELPELAMLMAKLLLNPQLMTQNKAEHLSQLSLLLNLG